jgi:hypothetical protein
MSLLALSAGNEKHLQIEKLVNKARVEKPKEADLGALRDLLRQCPETWKEGQDLVSYVTETCINKFYDNSPAFKEIVILKIEALKTELDWQNSSPVERLLIGSVTLNYLRWMILGLTFDRTIAGSHTVDSGSYWSKLLDRANRQYLRSLEALTKFRKLAITTPSLRRDLTSEVIM